MKKLLFVFDHKREDWWMDGLWAALNILEKDFEVTKLNLFKEDSVTGNDFSFILGWGGFNSPVDLWMHKNFNGYKKGLCIGGNAFPPTGSEMYDVLFHETKWYRPQINFHKNIVHAFGINTDIYNDDPQIQLKDTSFATPVIFDYIGVGSLSSWKRWDKMIAKKGNKIVIGEYQTNNEAESLGIAQTLLKGNVIVSNMINPYDLSILYRHSLHCYIPAEINGGGERAILEARSCGLDVIIEEDNPKLRELLDCPIYDEKNYATKLKQGIESVL